MTLLFCCDRWFFTILGGQFWFLYPMDSAQRGGNHLPAGSEHSPVPAPKGPDKGKRDEWNESGVLCLLEVYESKWLLRNRAKLKGSDWEDIARQVSARCSGTKALKTPAQCKNKIESMKKRYRAESAAAHEPKSCSSWQFYARMDGLLKGTPDCIAQTKSNHNINLQALPKLVAEVEVEGRLKDSNQDDASNALPVDANAVNKDNDDKKESKGDTDVSVPRNKVANAEDEAGKAGNPSKRRKGSGDEVADSIRLLAQSIFKIEQARMEMYKDSERMRVEAEIKRGEMELKRTEIIAKTQLQIMKLFAKRSHRRSNKSEGSSSGTELDMLPGRDRMVSNIPCSFLDGFNSLSSSSLSKSMIYLGSGFLSIPVSYTVESFLALLLSMFSLLCMIYFCIPSMFQGHV